MPAQIQSPFLPNFTPKTPKNRAKCYIFMNFRWQEFTFLPKSDRYFCPKK